MRLNRRVLQRLPKTEIHCHLDGCLRPATILELAEAQGVKLPTTNLKRLTYLLQAGKRTRNLGDYLRDQENVPLPPVPVTYEPDATSRLTRLEYTTAVSDYMKSVPEMIQRWVPGGLYPLGTDGFGRSETRQALRRHFEVDAEFITLAALHQLAGKGALKPADVKEVIAKLGIDPEKLDPMRA